MNRAISPRVPHAAALYVGLVQFVFVTCWTVYVIFLPALLETSGIPRRYTLWILILDQLIFMVMDTAMGVAADRTSRALGRIAPFVLTGTVVSCIAFLLIPHVALAGAAAPGLLLALILIWATTSSALRAPPLVLLTVHAGVPTLPWMNALLLTGLGLGAAIAPYLGIALKNLDPRVPFAVSSLALLVATVGLVRVERLLGAPMPVARAAAASDGMPRGAWMLIGGYLLLALGFQIHYSLNSGAQYLRVAPLERLEYLMPVFWIGFNLAMFPGAALARRHGTLPVIASASALGTVAEFMATQVASLEGLIAAQLIAGGAWGCALMAGFSAAAEFGRAGREGLILGLLFAALAVATLARMGVALAGLNQSPEFAAVLTFAPAALWCAACVLLTTLAVGARKALPS